MSDTLEPRVPDAVVAAFARDAPLTEGLTALLLTVRDDGFPHVAMLSVGEVVVRDETTLGLGLWPRSTATANLRARGRASLSVVLDGASWTLFLTTVEEAPAVTGYGELARFAATVSGAVVDRAPYADLTGGVAFKLKEPDQVLPRWAALRELLAIPAATTEEQP